jgi:DNA-binding XRE family transcriptional regulator
MEIAQKESDAKFGKAQAKLADDKEHADTALGSAVNGLNDALAKQAALADSRFEKTVKDITAARKEAADAVSDLRKDFATQIAVVTAESKKTEQILVDNIAKVSGEVISLKANQARVNAKVDAELGRIEDLANHRFSESKKARGKLRMLMDENKQAAAEEVKALKSDLTHKLKKLRATNSANRIEMAKDLSVATETMYEKMSNVQKENMHAIGELNSATAGAKLAAQNALARAEKQFDTKIIMLTNTVAANAAKAERGMSRLTGVVHDTAKAAKADRDLIKDQTKSMEADLNKALNRAISIGEAKAKAVEQRIAEHLKNTKRFLQVELNESVEKAADNVFKIMEGKRQKIADNYLSLKAYAVSAADKVEDYVSKGKGRALSSVGDLLVTVGSMGAVHAKPAEGLGMGGSTLPQIFSGDEIKVSNAVAAINGLVNEYTEACVQVRQRWPMGLGKYLMDKLEESMTGKGVLQVDKVEGKSGNFVYVNGRSVGLSNKLSDFSTLASRMTTYESVLAKMTSKITAPKKPAEFEAPPPEWMGN